MLSAINRAIGNVLRACQRASERQRSHLKSALRSLRSAKQSHATGRHYDVQWHLEAARTYVRLARI